MHLYFYAAKPSQEAMEYYQNITELDGIPECIELEAGKKLDSTCISQLSAGKDVILLFVMDADDILYVRRFTGYLEDFLVIFILYNSNLSLLNRCYGLQPRFVCLGKTDFSLLSQVLLKIFTGIEGL